jgi:hypothetical protein
VIVRVKVTDNRQRDDDRASRPRVTGAAECLNGFSVQRRGRYGWLSRPDYRRHRDCAVALTFQAACDSRPSERSESGAARSPPDTASKSKAPAHPIKNVNQFQADDSQEYNVTSTRTDQ